MTLKVKKFSKCKINKGLRVISGILIVTEKI